LLDFVRACHDRRKKDSVEGAGFADQPRRDNVLRSVNGVDMEAALAALP
jgi:hypothetical protein